MRGLLGTACVCGMCWPTRVGFCTPIETSSASFHLPNDSRSRNTRHSRRRRTSAFSEGAGIRVGGQGDLVQRRVGGVGSLCLVIGYFAIVHSRVGFAPTVGNPGAKPRDADGLSVPQLLGGQRVRDWAWRRPRRVLPQRIAFRPIDVGEEPKLRSSNDLGKQVLPHWGIIGEKLSPTARCGIRYTLRWRRLAYGGQSASVVRRIAAYVEGCPTLPYLTYDSRTHW